MTFMNYIVFLIALLSVFLTSLAQVVLRKLMLSTGDLPTSYKDFFRYFTHLAVNIWFVGGILLYVFSFALWLFVLKKTEVSQAYPLSAIGFLITACIGYLYLDEDLNWLRLTGLFFVVLGILIISRS